jgi:hypothetical protein
VQGIFVRQGGLQVGDDGLPPGIAGDRDAELAVVVPSGGINEAQLGDARKRRDGTPRRRERGARSAERERLVGAAAQQRKPGSVAWNPS